MFSILIGLLKDFIAKKKGKGEDTPDSHQKAPEPIQEPSESTKTTHEKDKDKQEESPKEKEPQKTKKKHKKKKKGSSLTKSIFFQITLLVGIAYLLTILFTLKQPESLILYARLSHNEGKYDVSYIFEENIENIFDSTKVGDEFPIDKMTLGDIKIKAKLRILEIDKETGTFKTNLPHKISEFYYSYDTYKEDFYTCQGYVRIEFKISSGIFGTQAVIQNIKGVRP